MLAMLRYNQGAKQTPKNYKEDESATAQVKENVSLFLRLEVN